MIAADPTAGIEFFPGEKRRRYVPPIEDLAKVLKEATRKQKQYILTILHLAARVGQVNRVVWPDVDFQRKRVTLYTRKKKGGNLTPHEISMSGPVYEILSELYRERDQSKPWVFWHKVNIKRGPRKGKTYEGPYTDRKSMMRTLCEKAGVKYFRFHPLRHFTASLLDSKNVPIGTIQEFLGHDHRETTEIYLHSIGDGQAAAVSVLDGLDGLLGNVVDLAPKKKSHTNPTPGGSDELKVTA